MVRTVSGEYRILRAKLLHMCLTCDVLNTPCLYESLGLHYAPLLKGVQSTGVSGPAVELWCFTTSFWRDRGWNFRIYASNIFPGYLDSTSVGTVCQGCCQVTCTSLPGYEVVLSGGILSKLNLSRVFFCFFLNLKAQDLLAHFLFFQKYFLRSLLRNCRY